MKKQNVRRDLAFDCVRDVRNPNIIIEVGNRTAQRQGIKPGWYSGRSLREVTK